MKPVKFLCCMILLVFMEESRWPWKKKGASTDKYRSPSRSPANPADYAGFRRLSWTFQATSFPGSFSTASFVVRRLITWPPKIWVVKKYVGQEGLHSVSIVAVTNFVSLKVSLESWSSSLKLPARIRRRILHMTNATVFLPSLKYRGLSFTNKFCSRKEH